MKFDPSKYETVKERKAKFYTDHADGRIIVELVNAQDPLDYALFKASVYIGEILKSTGYALEIRDKELSTSSSGNKYESVNYSSWTENCEESAVGRALDNAGYSGNKKPSREEMEKAQRMNTTMKSYNQKPPIPEDIEDWCDYHKCKLTPRYSEKKKKWYPYHSDPQKGFCFGKGYPSEIKAYKEKTQ